MTKGECTDLANPALRFSTFPPNTFIKSIEKKAEGKKREERKERGERGVREVRGKGD